MKIPVKILCKKGINHSINDYTAEEIQEKIYDDMGHINEIKEEMNKGQAANKKSAPNYEIYHDTYTSAVQEAEKYVLIMGYEVDKEQMAQDIGLNTSRPKEGQTTRFSIDLYKDGKLQRKKLHAQVFCMEGGRYELNMYIN